MKLAVRCSAVVLLIVLGACSTSGDDDAGGSDRSVSSTAVPAAPSTVLGESVDDSTGSVEIDYSGPVVDRIFLPGGDGYLEALGVDAVRVTANSVDTELDRSGTARVVFSGPGGRAELWLIDGEIYDIADDALLPRVYGLGLVRTDAQIGVFVDEDLLAMLEPGEEVTDEAGNPLRNHVADPSAVLAYHQEANPDWEWESATLEAVSNPAGAMLELTYRKVFTPAALPGLPPAEQVEEVWTYTVEPIAGPLTPPTDTLHPAASDHLATEILRRSAFIYDALLTDQVFDASATGPVTLESIQSAAMYWDWPSPTAIFRFVDEVSDFDNAGERTIGYADDGVFVLQAADGRWHCIAWRQSLNESTPQTQNLKPGQKSPIEAVGDDRDKVAQQCRQQRTGQ